MIWLSDYNPFDYDDKPKEKFGTIDGGLDDDESCPLEKANNHLASDGDTSHSKSFFCKRQNKFQIFGPWPGDVIRVMIPKKGTTT